MAWTEPLDLVVRHGRREIADFRAEANPEDHASLRSLLLGAMRREHDTDERHIAEYSMDVYRASSRSKLFTFVCHE